MFLRLFHQLIKSIFPYYKVITLIVIWCVANKLTESQAMQFLLHYENMPIQIYWKFYRHKNENFQIKSSDIFHNSAQNIDCGYS